MKTYLSLFKMKIASALQYRAAAIAGVSTQVFFGLVFIMVYLAFYESNDTSNAPMNIQALINYIWLNQAFYSLTYIWIKDKDLISMIKNGNIAYELCRPINFYFKWYSTMYANRIANVTLRFGLCILIAFILPGPYHLTLPISLSAFVLFILGLILSSLIVTSIAIIYHLVVFFTLDEKGIMTFLMVFGEIFSGGTVPISFFPKALQFVANILPFRYVCDLPFRIYSGDITVNAAIPDLLLGVVWLIVLVIFGYLLSKKALKNACVQGG